MPKGKNLNPADAYRAWPCPPPRPLLTTRPSQERRSERRSSRRHVWPRTPRPLAHAHSCSRTRRKEPRHATLLWSSRTREVRIAIPFYSPIHHVPDLEDEIKKLEVNAELPASDKSRLTSLKNELSKILEKKDEYVKEHPEQRKLVYRAHKQEKGEGQKEAPPPVEQRRNLFNKHGLPRHPERSIYYDPVMNPYGVPPPGMPYIERRKCLIGTRSIHSLYRPQLSTRMKWTATKTSEVVFFFCLCTILFQCSTTRRLGRGYCHA